MRKMISALLLCSLLCVSAFAGCGHNDTDVGDSVNNVSQADYKTVEPPEDGWSIEELLSVTYLFDKQLSYPITEESLPDGLELDIENALYTDKGTTNLLYHGEYFSNCVFTVKDEPLGMPEEIIFFDIDKRRSQLSDKIVVNGIHIGDSESEVYNSLGEPNDTNEISYITILKYFEKNDRKQGVNISINNVEGTVTGINIFT